MGVARQPCNRGRGHERRERERNGETWHHRGSSQGADLVLAPVLASMHDASGGYSANGMTPAPEHRVMLMWPGGSALCASTLSDVEMLIVIAGSNVEVVVFFFFFPSVLSPRRGELRSGRCSRQ